MVQSKRALLLAIALALIALASGQWEDNTRRRQLTRSLGVAAMKTIDHIKHHTSYYDEWLVQTVDKLKVSDGFASIRVPDNVLELWSIMSQGPSEMERRIDEITPHNIGMPEEEKLMCAIVSRLIWEKLQRDAYEHTSTDESLTLTFRLTYEELLPPYLAMSGHLSLIPEDASPTAATSLPETNSTEMEVL